MENNEEKKCAFCNSETALALFGVALGVLFIVLSLDTLRRIRLSEQEPNLEHYLEGGTVND